MGALWRDKRQLYNKVFYLFLLYRIDCSLDETQQYLRRDCPEITGVPITSHHNPKQLGKEIATLIDLFTHTAAILNSIVLTEKLWAAEGAIAGKFIVYTAFRINFYCLSLIFHNKYYKRYIFPSRYLAVVPMVIEKLLLKVITPQYSF